MDQRHDPKPDLQPVCNRPGALRECDQFDPHVHMDFQVGPVDQNES